MTWMSSGTIAVITPEIPPRMKLQTKPSANSIPVLLVWITPLNSVAEPG